MKISNGAQLKKQVVFKVKIYMSHYYIIMFRQHNFSELAIYYKTRNCNSIIFIHVGEGKANESLITKYNEQSVIFTSE